MAAAAAAAAAAGHSHSSNVFNQLQPLCLDLFEFLQNPKKSCSTLVELADFVRCVHADDLQPFVDYALFPLMLLLDAAVLCSSQQKGGKDDSACKPQAIGDIVAENALLCIEEVLKKCHLGSVDLMVVVLRKLASGALLSPAEASEEFREGIIRCLRALLLRLHPCHAKSCLCKSITGLPAFILGNDLLAQLTSPYSCSSEPEECLLAFLQSDDAAPAIGHWLSLLLQTADTEVARGLRGSGKLRTEAFLTFRVLVAKVGTADALAYFLPGVVSQLAKVLRVSKTMISGAAGSAESLDNAIRGLTEFLMVVLGDESNINGLHMSISGVITGHPDGKESTELIIDALRHLPVNAEVQKASHAENSVGQPLTSITACVEKKRSLGSSNDRKALRINRTKKWLEETSVAVDKILAGTFPYLCTHTARRVKQGIVDSIQGLMLRCRYTLERSKFMLLECMCILACDSEAVSVTAREFLELVFMAHEKYFSEDEVAEIFSRLVEKLPIVVLGSEEATALLHVHKLLAVMYHAGPQLVVDHLLSSPVVGHFLEVLILSLSHYSVFAGSFAKLIRGKQNSVGYLHSIEELKAGIRLYSDNQTTLDSSPSVSIVSGSLDHNSLNSLKVVPFEVAQMPPWFIHSRGQKLYQALAGVLRLVGFSIMADCRNKVSLSVLANSLLDDFRKLISKLRMREYSKESWHSWYSRNMHGNLLRQASTTVCVINEIIFGTSDECTEFFAKLFWKPFEEDKALDTLVKSMDNESVWKFSAEEKSKVDLADCVGSILHEYLSEEVWHLPTDKNSSKLALDAEDEYLNSHFFWDTTVLHQVIIGGIGIFGVTLGKDFSSSGFLHASLFLLLENLVCSSNQIQSAADAVLRMLSACSGHPTVGHLVVANADYIVDSLCRQLRHLDLNPHVLDVLTAILSVIGVAREILPLLEEPMRTVSMELEVFGRHQHPALTIPFLKAVREISRASRNVASAISSDAESFCMHLNGKVSEMEQKARKIGSQKVVHGKEMPHFIDDNMLLEQWEETLFKLDESRRFRHITASIAGSCLTSATPLLASTKEAACLVALGIVEDGLATLAKVEEAFKYEKETKEAIARAIQFGSFQDRQEDVDTTDEEADENRLLPAMNKIWPYLVMCIKNRNMLAVRRCMAVVSSVVQNCGGDFFTRRFHTDGSHLWNLLTTSPFQRKTMSKEKSILLPYRGSSESPGQLMAEGSNIKVQSAVLNMIAEISRNKRSSSAFESVLKKISGLVVGIACSNVTALREASINALLGLACMDSDLIWLLLADVYYSLKKDFPSPPTPDLPSVSELLLPPLSDKGYLYVQYGGESFGFSIDISSVELAFRRLDSEIFSH